jgi:hypothetical protein
VVPGTLTINGNYTQGSGGTLEIDLGGTGQGLMAVSGAANLAGTLEVNTLPGFTPQLNEQFNFLTYGALSGGFDSIVSLLPGYIYDVSYANGIGTLTVETVGVPESSTLFSALLMLSAGGVALRRRRKRAAA